MILDRHGKWLFVSTMKCATNSLYKALPGMPLWHVTGQFHARPNRRLARTHFTVVRNPYDRAVSIWASTCLREGDRYGAVEQIEKHHGKRDNFEDFCRFCLTFPPDDWAFNAPLFGNQADWIDTFLCDKTVPFEDLQSGVDSIVGDHVELPVENKSEHKTWKEVVTPFAAMVIEDWADKDFRFGYRKLDMTDFLEPSYD